MNLMAKKNKKASKKRTKRLLLFGMLCLIVNGYLIYSLVGIWQQVYQKKHEKEELSEKLTNLQETEEELKVQVNKLKDPDYVAKYAREKYLYSGSNEYIIRIK